MHLPQFWFEDEDKGVGSGPGWDDANGKCMLDELDGELPWYGGGVSIKGPTHDVFRSHATDPRNLTIVEGVGCHKNFIVVWDGIWNLEGDQALNWFARGGLGVYSLQNSWPMAVRLAGMGGGTLAYFQYQTFTRCQGSHGSLAARWALHWSIRFQMLVAIQVFHGGHVRGLYRMWWVKSWQKRRLGPCSLHLGWMARSWEQLWR